MIVGPALDDDATAGRSHVYDPGYGHRYRPLGRPDRYRTRRRGMEQPELREPNLPASARRVANSKLRRGWTTGTCATAAAKAACLLLRDGDAPGRGRGPARRAPTSARRSRSSAASPTATGPSRWWSRTRATTPT